MYLSSELYGGVKERLYSSFASVDSGSINKHKTSLYEISFGTRPM